jgi:Pyridoxamine 5''-phosphate oxidase.
MEKLDFTKLSNEIERKLKSEQTIILATCADNKVTARTMAPVNQGLSVLFSTNRNSVKIEQIKQNQNIALAVGNMKIEAVAELFGHPKEHAFFTAEYPKKFPQYGALYPDKPEDILVIARPIKISLYKYFGKPCEDVLDLENNTAYRISL